MHISARTMHDTDWSQIVALYNQLVRFEPSPINFTEWRPAVDRGPWAGCDVVVFGFG